MTAPDARRRAVETLTRFDKEAAKGTVQKSYSYWTKELQRALRQLLLIPEQALLASDPPAGETVPEEADPLRAWASLAVGLLARHESAWDHDPGPGDEGCDEDCRACEYTALLRTGRAALAAPAQPTRAELPEAVREAAEIAEASPELNPSNYDHEQVCELNDAMIRMTLLLRSSLTAARQPEDGGGA